MSRFGLGFIGGRPGIALVGFTSKLNASSGTSLVLDLPSGVQAGDLLAAVVFANGPTTWTPPAGWTEDYDQGANVSFGIAHLIASGSEPSTYTFTSSSTRNLSGYLLAHRNAAFDVAGVADTTRSNTQVAPAVTLSASDSTLVSIYAEANSGLSWSTPSGMTLLQNLTSNSPSSAIFTQDKLAAGDTGTRTATTTANVANMGCVMFGIKPA